MPVVRKCEELSPLLEQGSSGCGSSQINPDHDPWCGRSLVTRGGWFTKVAIVLTPGHKFQFQLTRNLCCN